MHQTRTNRTYGGASDKNYSLFDKEDIDKAWAKTVEELQTMTQEMKEAMYKDVVLKSETNSNIEGGAQVSGSNKLKEHYVYEYLET